jgi:hypothetical protein
MDVVIDAHDDSNHVIELSGSRHQATKRRFCQASLMLAAVAAFLFVGPMSLFLSGWPRQPGSVTKETRYTDRDDDFPVDHDDSDGRDDDSSYSATSSSRISYRLVENRPYSHAYNQYKCTGSRRGLPPELSGRGILDFFPDVTASNVTVLVLGDSIAMQIAQTMELAWGVLPQNRRVDAEDAVQNQIVSRPVRGGGALLTYRHNWLIGRTNKAKRRRRRRQMRRLAAMRSRSSVRQLLDHGELLAPTFWDGGVDVVVQRITYPWTSLDAITLESLQQNTDVVAEVFRPRTLIYINMVFNNNVVTSSMYEQLLEKRELVRNFTRGMYAPTANGTIRRVLLLDMDVFTDQINERNAQSIGFDTSVPFAEWMLGHVKPPWTKAHVNHIAHTCAERVPDNSSACPPNSITLDGMHFCPHTVGGRVVAGLACLMECAERGEAGGDHLRTVPKRRAFDLRTCEQQCNRKFMSLDAIPASEMIQWNETTR